MPYADVAGGRLWYEAAGEGPPVVLLHAGIVDARMWDAQMRSFAPRHRVLRYDLRGFGRSDRPTGPWSETGDLAAVMDAAGIERAALVGNSLGGLVAIDFAIERPERVDALVLVASALRGYGFDDGATPEQARRWEEAEERGDLEAMAEIDLELWAPLGGDGGVREMVLDNARLNVMTGRPERPDTPAVEWLDRIEVPALVVTGSEDVSAMDEIADVLVSRIPRARKVVVDGADHLVPLRQPAAFDAVVLDFLARVAQSGR
ncbi:MAG TPA: alpha/beta fold hydrolase [Gaiellaceae bacterium]|nr:alpha/beta fold hydrolase [Gaiellaceae bacterium]